MDNGIMLFENEEFGSVRVVEKNGDNWFVGKDVCDCLEIGDARKSIGYLDEDERTTSPVMDSLGRCQDMLIISESGLYSLILRSRKPEAKKFKKWITSEVLPTIRKHGGYLTPQKIEEVLADPDTIIRLAMDLKSERARRIEAERTKAMISSKREATVMGKLSAATKKVKALEDKLGEGTSWRQCKAVDWVPKIFANSRGMWIAVGRTMKGLSDELGYEVKKIDDPSYGTVNAYHVDVWDMFREMVNDDLNFLKEYRIDVVYA